MNRKLRHCRKQIHITGTFIKLRRKALGLKNEDLLKLLTPTMAKQYLSEIELGKSSIPTERIPSFAAALQVQTEELIKLMSMDYAESIRIRLREISEEKELKELEGVPEESSDPEIIFEGPVLI